MSAVYLLEPGVSGRWELVEVNRPDKPLISGALLPTVSGAVTPAARPACQDEPHPSTPLNPGIEP